MHIVLYGLACNLCRCLEQHAHIPIEEVARKTGFSDRYHFSKAFKARYGLTPVQMRRTLTAR